MNSAQLLAHFDHISDAPHAIPRLRRFILDLAVRGKLVEQDLRDEPASELLKRIQAKKTRLVSAGEMKKEKPLPVIEENEIPFAIPANWRWVRLNDVTSYLQRGKSPKYATGEGLPVISQKCIQWRGLDFDSAKLITRESIEEYESIRFLRSGDLLWNSTGTGTIGRIIKVKKPPLKLVCDSHVTVVRCLEVDPEYVRSWIRSDHVYAVIEDRAAGSTNQVELTLQLAMNQVVPLPPLAEQQRIVAKVDELMAICDRLEAAQAERESRRDRLAASSLNRLNNGADGDAFRTHAHFYFNHLARLTTRHEHIQQLRKTILNLAVRGQLVPQDTSDEPADNILIEISSREGGNTNGEGKLKTAFTRVPDEETPFRIPYGWTWTRIGCLCNMISGKGFKADEYSKSGARLFQIANVSFGKTKWESLNYLPISYNVTYPELVLNAGDLVMALNRPLLNRQMKAAIIGEKDLPAILYQRVGKFLFYSSSVLPEYFFRYLQSLLFIEQLEQNLQGSDQPFINKSDTVQFLIPLPPLAEQHRIVAKVDELMALCDRLEAQLTSTQTESRRLLEAVLHEALAGQGELEQCVLR